MAHTRLGRQFLRALRIGQAAHCNPQFTVDELIARRDYSPVLSRRRFLKASAALATSAFLAGCRPITALPTQSTIAPTIAIVGAGLAGLNAAYQLKKAGYRATIYEAANRVGGRIFTVQDRFGPGISTDLGGELIDTGHADMHALIKEFGLAVTDYQQPSEQALHDYFYFDGQRWPERTVSQELAPSSALSSFPHGAGHWPDHYQHARRPGSAGGTEISLRPHSEVSRGIEKGQDQRHQIPASAGMGSMAGASDRHLLRAHRLLRHCQRKLHYGAIPGFIRAGLLVHRVDVIVAGALLRSVPERGDSHQAIPGGRVDS